MLSRLGEAMKDAAETLRRAFQDPPSRSLDLALEARPGVRFQHFSPVLRPGWDPLAARAAAEEIRPVATARQGQVGFQAVLQQEEAWSAWASSARVVAVPALRAGSCARLQVPALPRSPRVQGISSGAFSVRIRRGPERIGTPLARGLAFALAGPGVRRGLELALDLPIALEGLDLRQAPRAIQMRYGLLAVKATGENVRNLELLGRYLVPRKGVRELRPDLRTGKLLVLLGPEAAGAERGPLLLARRKDDRSLITTFLEEG